jgi:hypothetical protein
VWGLHQAAKYQGDVDNWVTSDLVRFTMTEGHGERTGTYLSKWHLGRRVFDSWTERPMDSSTIKFEYWYLNPLQRYGEHVDMYVDKRGQKPWPRNVGTSLRYPSYDYPILRIETSLNKD